MNLIDKIISFFSPSAGLQRKLGRARLRAFDAAKRGRRLSNWAAGFQTNNNSLVAASVEVLRNRSRDLMRNNSYAHRAVQVRKTNAVGTGIRASLNSADQITEQEARQAWREWAETTACDLRAKRTIYGLQSAALESMDRDGEVFLIRRIVQGELKIMLLSAEYLDNSKDTISPNRKIRQGIEFDDNDRVIAYWLYRELPNDLFATDYPDSQRYSAKDVIHLYIESIPGQFRGVPTGAPAFVRMHNLNSYEDAQLERQKIAATFAAFVTGEGSGSALLERDDEGNRVTEVQPGAIHYLPPNQEITFPAPPQTEDYSEFVRQQLRAIAVAYGITYEALAADYENVNFSSSRMGRMEMDNVIHDLQHVLLIPQLCTRIWRWFVEYQTIRMPRVDWTNIEVTWTPPRREFIDPVKEANGLKTMLRGGLISPQEAIRKMGYDPEKVLEEIETWNEMADEKELMFDTNPSHDARRSNFGEEDLENTDEDEN